MRAFCEATNLPGNLQSRNSSWYQVGDWCLSEAGSDEDATFMAAATPDLLLRLVAHAENVLDRHHVTEHLHTATEHLHSGVWCSADDPCPEVAAVIKAWTL